jgi:hypothetical protein
MAAFIASKTEVRGHRIQDLATVGDIAQQRRDVRMFKGYAIKIENLITVLREPWKDMAPGFARATGEKDALIHA